MPKRATKSIALFPRTVNNLLYWKWGENLTLKEYRVNAGLRQSDVAKILDVEQAAVSQWENGKFTPLKKYRAKLAKLYGCTVNELLSEKEGES